MNTTGLARALSAVTIKKLMRFLGKMDIYHSFKARKERKLPKVLTKEEILRIAGEQAILWRKPSY